MLPLICKQQSKLNYNRIVHTAHTEDAPMYPGQVTLEVAPLSPIGHLLHTATLPNPEGVAALTNT